MASYANLSPFAERRRYPRALVVIVAGHAALIAAVMLAKMDLPAAFQPGVTKVELLPLPEDPPPNPPEQRADPRPRQSNVDQPRTIVPIPADPQPTFDPGPSLVVPDPGPAIGPALDPGPSLPAVEPPVRTGPRFATPETRLRPPYPPGKLARGEEAALRLRLSIDARGRVTQVEPVGAADPAFLASARRHLVAHWRYQPATEDGRPIASSTVITLRFELD